MIFVISGPSGSGKTTLLKNLLKAKGLKNRLVRSISFTTRAKRPDEKYGKDYFFISAREFQHKRRAQKLLEWTKYLGYYYATPKDFFKNWFAKNRHLILCLDLKGALKIKRLYPKDTVNIFVMPPSLGVLRERIKKRANKTKEDEVRERLGLAKEELLASRAYDYCLVNKDLGKTLKKLKKLILERIS